MCVKICALVKVSGLGAGLDGYTPMCVGIIVYVRACTQTQTHTHTHTHTHTPFTHTYADDKDICVVARPLVRGGIKRSRRSAICHTGRFQAQNAGEDACVCCVGGADRGPPSPAEARWDIGWARCGEGAQRRPCAGVDGVGRPRNRTAADERDGVARDNTPRVHGRRERRTAGRDRDARYNTPRVHHRDARASC